MDADGIQHARADLGVARGRLQAADDVASVVRVRRTELRSGGPPRGFAGVLASAGTIVPNWTAGCIALSSDGEIEAIAAWLRRRTTRQLRLEPPRTP